MEKLDKGFHDYISLRFLSIGHPVSSIWKNSVDLLVEDNSTNHHVQACFLDAPGDRLGRHNFCGGNFVHFILKSSGDVELLSECSTDLLCKEVNLLQSLYTCKVLLKHNIFCLARRKITGEVMADTVDMAETTQEAITTGNVLSKQSVKVFILSFQIFSS